MSPSLALTNTKLGARVFRISRAPFFSELVRSLTRGATMTEEIIFIQRRISHYGAMLKLDLDDENRATLNRLLEEDERRLECASDDRQNTDACVAVMKT